MGRDGEANLHRGKARYEAELWALTRLKVGLAYRTAAYPSQLASRTPFTTNYCSNQNVIVESFHLLMEYNEDHD
jgi:hypothetical protein